MPADAEAVDLLGNLFRSSLGHLDAMTGIDPVFLEHPPQVFDDRLICEGLDVLRLRPAGLHAGEHQRERRAQNGIVQLDPQGFACVDEEVQHERVQNAVGHGEVPTGGEGGDGRCRGGENDPVLLVSFAAPWFERARAELGEEPVEVEADRQRRVIGHEWSDRGFSAPGRPGEEEKLTGLHTCIIACDAAARGQWARREPKYPLAVTYPTAESRRIAAPAVKVWSLVSDLPRMGEWSPENEGGSWADGVTGPALGATFAGKNRNGFRRWSTAANVVACEPGCLFEIAVTTGRMPVARWRYEFEPTPEGCLVTESWLDERSILLRVGGRVLGAHDAAHAHKEMAATLANVAAAAER